MDILTVAAVKVTSQSVKCFDGGLVTVKTPITRILKIVSGVHLNFSSKLTLKSRTHHSSICRVKTQTTQSVRLDVNS
jgi:hypothetical protein